MASNSMTKLKTLYILKILLEKSDEVHGMTIQDIIRELNIYNIPGERKSITTDIKLLIEFGVDIVVEKRGRGNIYYIASRDFELPELKLLVDVVQASKFITHKKSRELIQKIEKLASVHEAKSLDRSVIVSNRVKMANEHIYYSIDAIHQGIQLGRKIEFQYTEYNIEKELVNKREGAIYCVSPYALSYTDEHYYLIAHHDRYDGISHFRVDRMQAVCVSEKVIGPEIDKSEFNPAVYSKKIFGMFSGEDQKVTLEFDHKLMNAVIDKFGDDIFVHHRRALSFQVTIDVVESDTFFAWLMIFRNRVKIIRPQSVKDNFVTYLHDVLSEYE